MKRIEELIVKARKGAPGLVKDNIVLCWLEAELAKNKKLRTLLKQSDKETRRYSVTIEHYDGTSLTRTKTRYQPRVADVYAIQPDKLALENAAAPNIVHSLDAAILNKVIAICRALGIPITVIHDSIGTTLNFKSLVIHIYKTQIIEVIEHIQKQPHAPYSFIYRPAKSFTKEDLERLITRILESPKLFL